MDNIIEPKQKDQVISPTELLKHWQGHRDLTRRIIDAFPEDKLFTHRIGGMRTFADMTMELLGIAGPGIKELATGEQEELNEKLDHGNKKARLLKWWDEATSEINYYWEKIELADFHKKVKAFGLYEGTVISTLFYFIDNEIHHRGQGYVYLRDLGIEPPAFWDR